MASTHGPKGGVRRLFGGASWPVVVLTFVFLAGCAPDLDGAPGVMRLTQAQFAMGTASAPPPHDAERVAVTLPDRWSRRQPAAHGSGWYRFELQPVSCRRCALLLGDVNMNAEAFINGKLIGSGGSFDEPVAQHWNRPLLFPFDGASLTDGGVLDIHVFAYAGDWGGLGPPSLGALPPLAESFDAQWAAQVMPAQIASVLALMMVLLFGALWLSAGRLPMYGYFALAAACFFVHSLSFHLRDIPVPFWIGRWLIHVALDWFGVWQLRALHRWLGEKRQRLELAVLGWVAVGSVATFVTSLSLGSARWFIPTALLFHSGVIALLPYAIVVVVRRWAELRRVEATTVLGGTVVIMAVAFHALVAHLGGLPENAPRLIHVTGPVLLLCFGAIMLADFLRTFRNARRLNLELERRVKDKEAELESNYERLRTLEGEQLLADERERIMREMHDGMGSSLVSTLSLVEKSGSDRRLIADAIRDALVDMRVVIDSLDPSVDDLATMLGMLRCRLAPRFTEHGVTVRWGVEDLPGITGWGPNHTLHAMRIVQEAITNVIKHAGATQLGVATGAASDGDGTFIRIWDDGCGMAETDDHRVVTARRGRGRHNMRVRAEKVGGRVTFEARAGGGTVVTLWLPHTVPTQSPSSDNSPKLTAS